MHKKWTEEEDRALAQAIANGILPENADIPGRADYSKLRRARKMRLIPPRKCPKMTELQEQLLRILIQKGYGAREIARRNLLAEDKPRSLGDIRKAIRRMGLVNPNRSMAGKNRKVWAPGEREKFLEFLRENSELMTQGEISQIWGVSISRISEYQKMLGIGLIARHLCESPSYRIKMQSHIDALTEKRLAKFEVHIAKRRRGLEEDAKKILSERPRIPRKTCPCCNTIWPKHRSFYNVRNEKFGVATCTFYRGPCKICLAKKRHEQTLAKYQAKLASQKT